MSAIGIAYHQQTGGTTQYNIIVDTFTGAEVARTYDASVEFERGISGQQVIGGRSGRQKFIWAISAVMSKEEAEELDNLFRDWDADRGTGIGAAVGITDNTCFGSVSASAVFSTPPSFIRYGPHSYSVAFGLTEV